MAYKVNSDGKAPKGLKTGDTVVTGGGTYKITGVNSDGSYQSTKVNNTTTSTYKGSYQTVPSSSGGGSSSGGSSGGSSWNSDRYTSTGGDVGLYGINQMANGASWQDVLNTWNDRFTKATDPSNPSLSQFAEDELSNKMLAYIEQGRLAEESAQAQDEYIQNLEQMLSQYQQPEYESQYDPAMVELMNKILSRDDFSYDALKDPLYQQYSSMYQQEGDRAMRETMAEAAASAGGMNSYAITAAQQANNYYNSQMANKIPELYQLAYQMYLQDKESDVQDLGILQNLDSIQYNRYRDTMQDYWNDKNFAYGVYQDAVAQGNWEKNFGYNQLVNDRNFNYGVTQDTVANNRYDAEIKREDELLAKEQAREEVYALLDLGQMPPSALLQAAGIDEAYASAYLAGIKAQQAKSSSGYTGQKTGSDDDNKNEDDSGYTGDKTTSGGGLTEEELVAKAAKETSSPNLTAESLNGMMSLGWIEYDEKEDKFKRTYDFGGAVSGLGLDTLKNGLYAN